MAMLKNQELYLSDKPASLCVYLQVSLPTRFIFLVLGPPQSTSIWEYEECGRAMAALLTDAVSISMYSVPCLTRTTTEIESMETELNQLSSAMSR